MKSHLPACREFYHSALGFTSQMKSRKKKLYSKHIDKNGHLHLPIYIKNIADDQQAFIIPDEELYDFIDQVERALRLYKANVPANIYIYTPGEPSDEFKALFLRCIQNTAHTEYITRRQRFVREIISLTLIFILGLILIAVTSHFSAKSVPEVIITALTIICNVMVWELIDYIIRVFIPSIRDLNRIIQIATAKFVIRHWD